MNLAPRIAVLIFSAAAIAACGDATTDPTNTGVSASLSASAVFDAAGSWKVESSACGVIPVPDQFDNVIQGVSNDIQSFWVSDFQVDNVVVFSSEGTLDAQTGAYTLCYSSTRSDCQMKCTGTVDAVNHVDLNCNKPNGDLICTMALQKK